MGSPRLELAQEYTNLCCQLSGETPLPVHRHSSGVGEKTDKHFIWSV